MGVPGAGYREPEHDWTVETIHCQTFVYEDDIRATQVSLLHLLARVKQESQVALIRIIVVIQKVALILF